jgi:hypothetical protein
MYTLPDGGIVQFGPPVGSAHVQLYTPNKTVVTSVMSAVMSADDTSHGPMRGIRVVELTTTIAGPAAGATLADWGAEVLKVEPPNGDNFRYILGQLGLPLYSVSTPRIVGQINSFPRTHSSRPLDRVQCTAVILA